ncbi:hypothetical protein RB195_020718 [Necator americanus]|uniref:Uncharacterized protein n=1 Tax=Necator americanus TaxID=51031 RepID=A0ABR1CK55_NECAM
MHVALLVLVCIVSILIIVTGAKQPCRTWPTYGLCPFQPIPGDFSTLFDTTVGEDCKDGNASERFVPCLFSAGFSCVMAFLNSSEIVAGCIRDIGSKLVKFERSPDNPRTVKIVDQEFALIRRSCGPPKNCSLAEVSIFNRSMILNVCCCKGEHCVKQKSYENKLIYDFEMKTEEEGSSEFKKVVRFINSARDGVAFLDASQPNPVRKH